LAGLLQDAQTSFTLKGKETQRRGDPCGPPLPI